MDLFTRRRHTDADAGHVDSRGITCAERASFRLRFFDLDLSVPSLLAGAYHLFPTACRCRQKSVTCDKSVVQRRHFCPSLLDALQ